MKTKGYYKWTEQEVRETAVEVLDALSGGHHSGDRQWYNYDWIANGKKIKDKDFPEVVFMHIDWDDKSNLRLEYLKDYYANLYCIMPPEIKFFMTPEKFIDSVFKCRSIGNIDMWNVFYNPFFESDTIYLDSDHRRKDGDFEDVGNYRCESNSLEHKVIDLASMLLHRKFITKIQKEEIPEELKKRYIFSNREKKGFIDEYFKKTALLYLWLKNPSKLEKDTKKEVLYDLVQATIDYSNNLKRAKDNYSKPKNIIENWCFLLYATFEYLKEKKDNKETLIFSESQIENIIATEKNRLNGTVMGLPYL